MAKLVGTFRIGSFGYPDKKMFSHLENITAVHSSGCLNVFSFAIPVQHRGNGFFFTFAGIGPRIRDDRHSGCYHSCIFDKIGIGVVRQWIEQNHFKPDGFQCGDVFLVLIDEGCIFGRFFVNGRGESLCKIWSRFSGNGAGKHYLVLFSFPALETKSVEIR